MVNLSTGASSLREVVSVAGDKNFEFRFLVLDLFPFLITMNNKKRKAMSRENEWKKFPWRYISGRAIGLCASILPAKGFN